MNRIIVAAAALSILAVTPAFSRDQRVDKNKAVVRRVFTEILSQGKFEITDELYAKNYVNHDTSRDLALDQSQTNDRGWRSAFPDLEMTVEKEIAEGDLVTVLWRGRGTNTGVGNGLNATGKKVDGRGISIFRVVNGKIQEEWTEYSGLLILRQMGLFPARP
jgi:predicted ester cyclase